MATSQDHGQLDTVLRLSPVVRLLAVVFLTIAIASLLGSFVVLP